MKFPMSDDNSINCNENDDTKKLTTFNYRVCLFVFFYSIK